MQRGMGVTLTLNANEMCRYRVNLTERRRRMVPFRFISRWAGRKTPQRGCKGPLMTASFPPLHMCGSVRFKLQLTGCFSDCVSKLKKKVQRILHSRSEKCGVGEGLTFTPLNWSARTEIPVTYDLCSPVIASSPSATVRLHAFLYL